MGQGMQAILHWTWSHLTGEGIRYLYFWIKPLKYFLPKLIHNLILHILPGITCHLYLAYLLPEIHCKSDKPNFTFSVFKTVNNCNACFIWSEFSVFQTSWFPAYNAVLTRLKQKRYFIIYRFRTTDSLNTIDQALYLRQDKVTKPSDTINIVTMNISCRKIWKVFL